MFSEGLRRLLIQAKDTTNQMFDITPDGSLSEPDDVEEEEKKVDHSYTSPRIE